MNKTKIDWATMSWNPVTGCRHGCPYCYAARTANRFNGHREDPIPLAEGIHILKEKPKAMPPKQSLPLDAGAGRPEILQGISGLSVKGQGSPSGGSPPFDFVRTFRKIRAVRRGSKVKNRGSPIFSGSVGA